MADASITFLLQTMKELVSEQIKLTRDAEKELQELQAELDLMNATLKEAADKKFKGEIIDTLVKQIRTVVYEAEDLIDMWKCEEQQAADKKFPVNTKRMDLAAKLKEFRERKIDTVKKTRIDLADELRKLAGSPGESNPKTKKARQVEPLVEKVVVGVQDEIQKLIAELKKNSTGVEAISILGMAGLGKTTVASKIFRDSDLDFEFPTRIWVNVFDDYKERDIYLTILKKFTRAEFSGISDSDLAIKAKKHLSQVKFLLVADDVWTVDAWKAIERALPIGTGSGKVLITSRIDKVATNANPRREPHRLRFLTGEESWKLLQLEVYGKEGIWPADSLSFGETISDKCGGLPLAIVVIGGILKDKIHPPESRWGEWKEVAERAEKYLLTNDKEREISMKDIIELSYDKIPHNLRDCFLYLGVYPRDFDISVRNLTRLWVAEGFIVLEENNSDQTLEDIARENLKELIRRNLVMLRKRNAQGEVKTCYVHDMIREFCKSKAAVNQLNIAQVISKLPGHGVFSPDITEIPKSRRIGIHSDVLEFLQEKPKCPHTRSFLCFSKHDTDLQPNSLQLIAESFELLRVFQGSSLKFPRFHKNLLKLIHLRYFAFSAGDHFSVLPDRIIKLQNLQTIIIHTSHLTFDFKANISHMKQLRHLKTKAAFVLSVDKKSEANKSLKTLDRLSIQSCKEEVLSKVPNLQTLGIFGELQSLLNVGYLRKLNCLKKLKMINVMTSVTLIPQLLDWTQFPPNLKILSLSATNFDWQYMSTLGCLDLEVLKLNDDAFRGDEWSVVRGEFRHLHTLQIERSNILMWRVEEGSLPQLRSLSVNNCERLLAIPTALAGSLQTLKLGLVSSQAVSSAKKIEIAKQSIPGHNGEFKLITAPYTII